MQAVAMSKHLRDHFDRAVGRGSAAYQASQGGTDLVKLSDALAGYSEAFALADVAVTVASSAEYARWADRRRQAFHAQKVVRGLIAALAAQGTAVAR